MSLMWSWIPHVSASNCEGDQEDFACLLFFLYPCQFIRSLTFVRNE